MSANPNSQSSKNFNYVKWGFVVAVISTIFAGLPFISKPVQEITQERITQVSPADDLRLLVKDEHGDPITGVQIMVDSSVIPPDAFPLTNSDGYTSISLPNEVKRFRVEARKIGYITKEKNIDLDIKLDTNRTIVMRPKFDKYRGSHPSSGNPSTEQTKPDKTKSQEQPKDTQQSQNSTETPSSETPKVPEVKTEACNVFVVYDPKDGYVNLRSSRSSPNRKPLRKVYNGNQVNVELNQEVGDWSKVNFGSSSGYMKSNLLRQSTTHYVFDKNDTFTNLRSAPNTNNGTFLRQVKNGTPLTILSNTESPKWVQVQLLTDDKAVGYMSRERIANPSCAS